MSNAKIIWDFLKSQGFNDYGCAGLMGNLDAESGLNPQNLQNTYNSSLKLSDTQYTQQVDNGTYANFINDKAGYGLAQWTWWSRKQNLLNYAKSKNKSIGDLNMQLEFLIKELQESFAGVYNTLRITTSVQQASDSVLMNFEAPANATSKKNQRAQMGMVYYNKFAQQGGNQTVGVKTYNETDRVQLSKNFNSYEFRCGLGSPCSCTTILIDDKLVEILQNIRDHFNASVTITSAYRCESYNKKIGGATGSRHSKGQAADISVKGVTPREVAKYAESIGVKGIGLYETSADGYFVHVDTRTSKSFWYGQNEQARSTFGGTTSNTTNTTINTSSIEVSLNDTGTVVKEIQQMLVNLGYSLTSNPNDSTKGIDGIYGMMTYKAVRDFQQKNNLIVDGIVGEETLNALESASNKTGYTVKITASALNVRSGPGMDNSIIGIVRKNSTYKILEIQDGWGKISSPAGWISMEYVIAI